MENIEVLIVEDDKLTLSFLSDELSKAHYSVTGVTNAEEALELAIKTPPDILLADIFLPGMSGIELVEKVSGLSGKTVSIILTARASLDTAINAMRAGAFTYLRKPLKVGELLVTLGKALEIHDLKEENAALKNVLTSGYKDILGNSSKIQEVFDLIEAVSDTDSTVLILGESGTGKELVARGIHFSSTRRDKPFVPINCGAIPENLLESELFGHVKGAFTGAISSRQGRFELASGGSLFLDEIGDMSPALQVKILRVLQEREFEPVGGTRSKKADVRIIAATNKDLEQAVRDGEFREDLYYRLNVIPAHVPPLRERREDIPILIEHFIEKFNRGKGRNLKEVSPKAMDILMNYSWPGNVRELENLVERMVILTREGSVGPEDLPPKFLEYDTVSFGKDLNIPEEGISLKDTVDEFENGLIIQALSRTGWNKNMAAQLLGIKRTTLVEKIKKKGITEKTSSG